MSQQCKGTTLKNKRCRKRVTDTAYCHLHRPKEKEEEEEEEKRYGAFPVPPKHLDERHRRMILKKIKSGPRDDDGDGFIYVYHFESDVQPYFKVGRTERAVAERLKEWSPDAVLVAKFATRKNRFVESLVHYYLDAWRVYRYKIAKDEFCSVWKKDGYGVTKHDDELKQKHKLEARKKQIEWFCVKKSFIISLINKVILAV